MTNVSEGTIKIAIESLIAQVADSYARSRCVTITEALQFYMKSKTFELLINPKSYLFLETAPYIEDMLEAEISEDWESWMEI